ncbi:MAG TPA: M20/M25/M40 family metallo-hydrolase, partial [Thermomicrobiales bacterium]|nr:M20/M25/M40 family metallo-hydrolase [Thermomicrobiales bacterium]
MAQDLVARALASLDERELLATLGEFVRIPSVCDPAAGTTEEPAARFVHALLARWGWVPSWEEVAPGRPNVVATLRGARPGPRLILEGHTDVVTPGDPAAWSHAPFGGEVVDGRLYGRGAADMKGGVIAALYAAQAVRASGAPFAGALTLAIVADEEGMMAGIKDFVARGHADDATAALVCEPEGGRVCVAQKGALRVRVTARGVMAHGAMPEAGANPVAALAEFLSRAHGLELDIQDEAGEHDYLGKFYLTPTAIAGGDAAQLNVIPASCVAYLDVRTTPLTPHADVLDRLRQVALGVAQDGDGCALAVDVLADRPPTTTDPDDPLVAAVVGAHEAV